MSDLIVSSAVDTLMSASSVNGIHAVLAPVEMTRQERMTASVSEGVVVKITDEGNRIEQYLGSRSYCSGLIVTGGVADGLALTRTDQYSSGRPVWASHPHQLLLGDSITLGEVRIAWDGTNWQMETAYGTYEGGTGTHPDDDGDFGSGGTVTESAVAGDQNWAVLFNSAYLTVENLSPYGTSPSVCLNSEENVLGSVSNSTPLEVGWVNEADVLFAPNMVEEDAYGDTRSQFEIHAIIEEAMPDHQHTLSGWERLSAPFTPRVEHLWDFINRPRPVVTVLGSLRTYV